MIAKLGRVAKAAAAGIFAAAASFQGQVDDGLTGWEPWIVAAAGIVAFGVVYRIPNKEVAA